MSVPAVTGGAPHRGVVTPTQARGGTDVRRITRLRQRSRQSAAIILFAATAAQTILAQDWPQWRGPGRDGAVASFAAPPAWPDQLKLKWKVKVGTGHSSPVVSGGRVYLHARDGEEEFVRAFDLATGRQLWQDSYPVAYQMHPAARGHGKGPKSTPVIADGKLYTLGITGVLSCYDLRGGRLRWRKETARQFDNALPNFGFAASPVVDRGLLIIHLGSNDRGALTAFNAETGEEKWRWAGDEPSYASPIVVELAGVRQVIVPTRKLIVGVAVETGALLWQIPYPSGVGPNIVTPVIYKQTLIYSGESRGTTAVRVVKRGQGWGTEEVWHNPDVAMYMNTPVVGGESLFGLSHKNRGQFFCLDAHTGKTLWTSPGRAADNAAVLKAGDALLLLTDDGRLTLARMTQRGYEPLKQYQVAESPTWAHPAIIKNQILIKDVEHLALWSLS